MVFAGSSPNHYDLAIFESASEVRPPFLSQHYPASTVIRPCPTPAMAAAFAIRASGAHDQKRRFDSRSITSGPPRQIRHARSRLAGLKGAQQRTPSGTSYERVNGAGLTDGEEKRRRLHPVPWAAGGTTYSVSAKTA